VPIVKSPDRAENREATRRKIGRVAVELFLRHGFQQTTADQIAETAGVSRRTFFRHFNTKEEALSAWGDDVGSDLAAVAIARPSSEPVFTTLRAALQALVDYAEQDVQRIRKLKELTGPTGLFPALREDKRGSWSTTLTTALAVRSGTMDPAGAALQVTAALLAYDWAMSRWLADPEASGLGDLVDQAFRIIQSGFLLPHIEAGR